MITLREVAKRAGVSTATVSCALRGQALVKAVTRDRVLKAARELGYRPNISAAVLAGRRHSSRHRLKQLTLGWMRSAGSTTQKSMAFEERAEALGYEVEWLDLSAYRSGAEASRALWYRNVCGLFIASPGAVLNSVQDFDWSKFAVVKFSRGLPELGFHLIRHSAFDYASRCLREVFSRGFRRVAVLLGPSASEWDDDARLGAVLSFREVRLPKGARLEVRRVLTIPDGKEPAPKNIVAWLRKFHPDCVVGFPLVWISSLRLAGVGIPAEMAFAAIICSQSSRTSLELAGCDEQMDAVNAAAVDLLHRQIMAGEQGIPAKAHEHIIEPIWENGHSLNRGGSPNQARKSGGR